jgi:hypothetical protein
MDQTKILSPNWLNHWLIVRDRTALFFHRSRSAAARAAAEVLTGLDRPLLMPPLNRTALGSTRGRVGEGLAEPVATAGVPRVRLRLAARDASAKWRDRCPARHARLRQPCTGRRDSSLCRCPAPRARGCAENMGLLLRALEPVSRA